MARDTRRDLVARFAKKQVMLGFPSLALRLAETQRQVVHVALSRRLRQDQVEDRWVKAMGCVGLCYPYFAIFYVLGFRGIVVFYLGL
jgi:hypothetical protein